MFIEDFNEKLAMIMNLQNIIALILNEVIGQ